MSIITDQTTLDERYADLLSAISKDDVNKFAQHLPQKNASEAYYSYFFNKALNQDAETIIIYLIEMHTPKISRFLLLSEEMCDFKDIFHTLRTQNYSKATEFALAAGKFKAARYLFPKIRNPKMKPLLEAVVPWDNDDAADFLKFLVKQGYGDFFNS